MEIARLAQRFANLRRVFSWQAQRFVPSGLRNCDRRSAWEAESGGLQIALERPHELLRAESVVGARFLHPEVRISWQAQHFRKVRCR